MYRQFNMIRKQNHMSIIVVHSPAIKTCGNYGIYVS